MGDYIKNGFKSRQFQHQYTSEQKQLKPTRTKHLPKTNWFLCKTVVWINWRMTFYCEQFKYDWWMNFVSKAEFGLHSRKQTTERSGVMINTYGTISVISLLSLYWSLIPFKLDGEWNVQENGYSLLSASFRNMRKLEGTNVNVIVHSINSCWFSCS